MLHAILGGGVGYRCVIVAYHTYGVAVWASGVGHWCWLLVQATGVGYNYWYGLLVCATNTMETRCENA